MSNTITIRLVVEDLEETEEGFSYWLRHPESDGTITSEEIYFIVDEYHSDELREYLEEE